MYRSTDQTTNLPISKRPALPPELSPVTLIMTGKDSWVCFAPLPPCRQPVPPASGSAAPAPPAGGICRVPAPPGSAGAPGTSPQGAPGSLRPPPQFSEPNAAHQSRSSSAYSKPAGPETPSSGGPGGWGQTELLATSPGGRTRRRCLREINVYEPAGPG